MAEARIREWQQRPAAEREATPLPIEPTLPLEVQLMQDIAQLDRMAAAAEPDEAAALKQRASELMLRLMVILERDGRPLAAQHFLERRRGMREGA